MFFPKKTKFKKVKKGRLPQTTSSLTRLTYGGCGLKSLESCRVTGSQLEAVRQNINRKIKRRGKIWIHVFPDTPLTSKPSEVRMGKGKGSVTQWVAKVPAGKLLFEVLGPNSQFLAKVLHSAANKLPIKTGIVQR